MSAVSEAKQPAAAAVAAASKPASKQIEIEQKYRIQPDTESRLLAFGAKFAGERTLTDTYFDLAELTLTLTHNVWLRTRNGKWQIKIPTHITAPSSASGGVSVFEESESESDILKAINSVIASQPLPATVIVTALTPEALKATSKLFWTPGFGRSPAAAPPTAQFSVAEVELLISDVSAAAAREATNQIDTFAASVGLMPLHAQQSAPPSALSGAASTSATAPASTQLIGAGKVEECMRQLHPTAFERYVKAGILLAQSQPQPQPQPAPPTAAAATGAAATGPAAASK